MSGTHTFAVMEVTPATYDEVQHKLKEAGYDHAFVDDYLDMHGVALSRTEQENVTDNAILFTGYLAGVIRREDYTVQSFDRRDASILVKGISGSILRISVQQIDGPE